MSIMLFVALGTAAILLFLCASLRLGWFKRLRLYLLRFRAARFFRKLGRAMADIDSPQAIRKRAENALAELREGQDDTKLQMQYINEALEAGWRYGDIGTNRDEVIGFRNGESQKILGRRLLAKYREKPDFPHKLERVLEAGGLRPEDVGTTAEEITAIDRAFWKKVYANKVADLRKIATGQGADVYHHTEPDKLYQEVLYAIERYHGEHDFTLEEFGTSREEFDQLLKAAWLAAARSWWEWDKNIVAGRNPSMRPPLKGNFSLLRKALANASARLEDIDLTEGDLRSLERTSYLKAAEQELQNLRTPSERWFGIVRLEDRGVTFSFGLHRDIALPGNPETIVDRVREHLAKADATLAEIGTRENEIAILLQKGYCYAAQFLLNGLRSIAKIPRMTKLEAMACSLPPNTRLLFGSAEERKQFGELEEQYPYERDIAAIHCYLGKAGASLETVLTSERELRELTIAFHAR